MKRKLDQDGVPAVEAPQNDNTPSFTTLGLDSRLLQGVAAAKFSIPTLVQAKAIPLALEGKDILGTAISMETPAHGGLWCSELTNWLKLVQKPVLERQRHISCRYSSQF